MYRRRLHIICLLLCAVTLYLLNSALSIIKQAELEQQRQLQDIYRNSDSPQSSSPPPPPIYLSLQGQSSTPPEAIQHIYPDDKEYTFFLDRHAEQVTDFHDPELTANFKMYKNRIEALDTGRFVAMVPKAHFSLDNQAIVGGTSLVDWSRRVVEWNETATADVKYFSECGIDKKRDARFATNNNGGSCLSEGNPKGVVRLLQEKHDSKKVHESLIAILQAWSLFSQEHKIYWWISHGEMIGWFWNSKLLPWETDLDIQISVQQLLQLVAYNQTLIQGGRFLLDVSPGFMVRSPQKQNVIDARVIDVTTGYMMDITALSRIRDDDDGTVYCKSPHGYKYEDLMPLHETLLEGVKVWRPHNVMKILRDEYQEKSMYQERFKRIYSWDRESLVWRSSVSGVGCILLGFVIPLLTISF